jgi:hypothetical protein
MELEPFLRTAKSLIHPLRLWKAGVHRLTAEEIEKLDRIKHKGVLIEVVPSIEDKPDSKSVVDALLPFHGFWVRTPSSPFFSQTSYSSWKNGR